MTHLATSTSWLKIFGPSSFWHNSMFNAYFWINGRATNGCVCVCIRYFGKMYIRWLAGWLTESWTFRMGKFERFWLLNKQKTGQKCFNGKMNNSFWKMFHRPVNNLNLSLLFFFSFLLLFIIINVCGHFFSCSHSVASATTALRTVRLKTTILNQQ